MRLQRVSEPPYFSVPCVACGERIGERDPKIADLDGPAFHAYYHVACTPHGVYRLDENPANCTFGQWVYVAGFKTAAEAHAYVSRAEGPTQRLRVRWTL